jgi:RNA polymerase sigma-70 factor (ECF subfamily)
LNAASSFPDDDTLLAHEARAGSASAFATLVHRYHARVFGFLLALTRHRQDAEDLTQETFLRAWRKFGRYDPGQPLLPWLFTLARRQSIAALRKKSRPLLPEELPFPAESGEAAPSDDGDWLWEAARRELSAESYSALWLHYRQELALKEVAKVLGKREGAVKVLLHRARKTLAESLRGRNALSEANEREEGAPGHRVARSQNDHHLQLP